MVGELEIGTKVIAVAKVRPSLTFFTTPRTSIPKSFWMVSRRSSTQKDFVGILKLPVEDHRMDDLMLKVESTPRNSSSNRWRGLDSRPGMVPWSYRADRRTFFLELDHEGKPDPELFCHGQGDRRSVPRFIVVAEGETLVHIEAHDTEVLTPKNLRNQKTLLVS